MTVRPSVVLARLAHLGTTLGRLEHLRLLSAEQRTDPLVELAAERALHVAIEAILDIDHHVLAGRGHPIPGSYREVIPALVRYGVLAERLGTRLDGSTRSNASVTRQSDVSQLIDLLVF